MAGLLVDAVVSDVSLTATTARTVLSFTAPANHRVKILGYHVSFRGTSNTDEPVKVELGRITTDGGTSSSLTLLKRHNGDDETIQSTARHSYTVEPTTYGDILISDRVHPQTQNIVYFPVGQEIPVKGGQIFGVRVTASQAQSVSFKLLLDE